MTNDLDTDTDPLPPGAFDPDARESLRRIIEARRDVRRRFLPTPVPDDVLERVLQAAHRAPSVGLTQPWDFLVLTGRAGREEVAGHVEEERRHFADSLPAARARAFADLKVEAILESSLNLVVTSTLERGGAHVLGRFTQPEMAHYSTCLAIENLWLTARAEGLGVGWVSFYRPQVLKEILGLPAHVTPIAYLCIGYVEDFDPAPELAQRGWARPRPLSWAVHREQWEERMSHPFDDARSAVTGLDPLSVAEAREHHGRLTKPAGSLGELEGLGCRLAGIARTSPPPVPEPATVAVFAGDHGVVASGVTPWPSEVTAQMVANFCGGGAAISAIARQVGAEVVVVDVGVAAELSPAPNLLRRKVRPGTANLHHEPAMSRADAQAALDVGAEVAREVVASGARCLITGDMGIGNTTPSAALIAYFTGLPVAEVVGRGTGIDDAMLAHKAGVIDDALRRTAANGGARRPAGRAGLARRAGDRRAGRLHRWWRRRRGPRDRRWGDRRRRPPHRRRALPRCPRLLHRRAPLGRARLAGRPGPPGAAPPARSGPPPGRGGTGAFAWPFRWFRRWRPWSADRNGHLRSGRRDQQRRLTI